MAEKFISPGVFTRENDLSFLQQGVAEIGTAIVGSFPKGPAFIPTNINSIEEFRNKFGGENEKYYATYAVKNVLENATSVTVVRVGNLGGYAHTGSVLTVSSASVTSSVFLAPSNGGTTIDVGTFETGSTAGSVYLSGSGIGVVTASFNPTDENYFTKVFGTNPLGSKGAYVYADFRTTNSQSFQNLDGATLSNSSQIFDFDNQDITGSKTPWVKSQDLSGTKYNLFKFHTLNDGTDTNREVKISIENVKRASELNTDFGRFDVVVRNLTDTDSNVEVLETFAGCNLNPSSPNYIARKIGDKYQTVDSDDRLVPNGDYPNNSSYIRVEMVTNPESLPETVVPAGFGGYYKPLDSSDVPALPVLSAGGDVTGSTKTHFGIDFDNSKDWEPYLAPVADGATATGSAFSLPSSLFAASATSSTDQSNRRFTFGFQGGFDGGNPNKDKKLAGDVTTSNVLGFDLSDANASGSVAYKKALNVIQNPLEFDYNLLLTPGVSRDYGTSVVARAKEIVEDRGDAFYISDLTWYGQSINTAIEHASHYDSSYMATYYPWVKVVDSTSQKPVWVPPSVVIGGVFAFNDSISSEWFAPAGLNRGGINGAVDIYKRLYRADMDNLYDAKVNPIVSYPGQGIVAWGQKTLQDKSSALDRINVRRLLINLKKFVASTSRFLVFDQNTNALRNRFLNLTEPYLDQVQQQQGLYAYRIVIDDTVNTPEVIDRNQLIGKIYIQPVKAAEFIVLDFNVMPTGAEFPQ